MLIVEKILAQAQATPLKPAFFHNGAPCSYAGFARRIARATRFLAAQRLPPGGVALLQVDDLAQAWVLGIALRHLGLDTLALAQPDELGRLGLAQPVACLLRWGAEALPEVAALPPGCRRIELPAALEDGADAMPAAPAATGGHIIPTSGTTGVAKLILRDARVEAGTLDLHAEINGITADSTVFVRDFPLWTAGGYRWPLLSWHQGATVVFQQGQDLHVPLFRAALTHAFATPMSLMADLRAQEDARQAIVRRDALRLLVTGGALPRALAAALKERLTAQVYTVLASTEALTVGTTRVEDLDELAWHRVHPAREAQVVDEADRPLPAGQAGLLRVRILDGVAGYLNDPAASRAFFRDGWFYSGDIAQRRADGRLMLCGRVTDVVNVLGHKIATAPVEAALQERLGADAVCLLSLPIAGNEEGVCVVIETRRSPSQAALQALAAELLPRFGPVHFFAFGQLPRNRMGKVLRPALHQLVLARLQRG